MDHVRFDTFTRSLSARASRRGLLWSLTGSSLAALVGLTFVAPNVDAKKKRHKRNKRKKKQKAPQPVLNQFGCLDIGQPCRGDSSLCCSGICEGLPPKKGKQDTSRCVAHNTGVCTANTDTCSAGVDVPCSSSNPGCFCTTTTGNAGYCGAFSGGPAGHCRVCSKDTDCEAEFGPGAACVVLDGICTPLCLNTGTTACAPPCA